MRKIIFSNEYDDNDFNDMLETYKDDGIELSDNEAWDIYNDNFMFWYEAEKSNLNIELDNPIIAIADLGFWNGRANGYRILGNNLNDILNAFDCDIMKVFCENRNVKGVYHHHDGTNYVTFRMIRNMDNIENLTDKIYEGKEITPGMLNYYTKSIYSEVQKVYGF